MTEAVERAARAICKVDHFGEDVWDVIAEDDADYDKRRREIEQNTMSLGTRMDYREFATAALLTTREPSEAEVEAAAFAYCAERGLDPNIVLSINSFHDDGRPEPDVAVPQWRCYAAAIRACLIAAGRVRLG